MYNPVLYDLSETTETNSRELIKSQTNLTKVLLGILKPGANVIFCDQSSIILARNVEIIIKF